jgi:hypothetical protein
MRIIFKMITVIVYILMLNSRNISLGETCLYEATISVRDDHSFHWFPSILWNLLTSCRIVSIIALGMTMPARPNNNNQYSLTHSMILRMGARYRARGWIPDTVRRGSPVVGMASDAAEGVRHVFSCLGTLTPTFTIFVLRKHQFNPLLYLRNA